jgi:hypothetical protein
MKRECVLWCVMCLVCSTLAKGDLISFYDFEEPNPFADKISGVIGTVGANVTIESGTPLGNAAVFPDGGRADNDILVAQGDAPVIGLSDFSCMAWARRATVTTDADGICDMVAGTNEGGFQMLLVADFRFGVGGPGNQWMLTRSVTQVVQDTNWHHYAVSVDRDNPAGLSVYINGVLDSVTDPTGYASVSIAANQDYQIGSFNDLNLNGSLDELAIFNTALTVEEIQRAMKGIGTPPELAKNPNPDDAVIDVPQDIVLSWQPGEFALKHDVYLGTIFDDVNEADRTNPGEVLISEAQDANSYDAGILDFGQTYYWRMDEVNGAPDRTVFKGDVWSFEVEPFSIPVETITATASSSNANMGPENTIGGAGLNELDQHSTDGTTMWLSGMGDPTPSIQYEFDKAYKLHEMLVWNSNQLVESFVGIGAKDVVVETSVDGATWTVLEGATLFNQATGTADYTANTAIDLAGVMAKYIKITVNAGWGIMPQYGLSEVRFTYIPVEAREPQPAHEAADVAVSDAALSWRAGREAVTHEVYLSTDPDALELIDTTTEPSDAATLDLASTYYWQIVEVNNAEAISAWAGDVWTFSTEEYIVIDNFESYNDDIEAGTTIWQTWLDGVDLTANGGSQVGYSISPFAELTIVHGGNQSMPLTYDTAGVSFAETVRTFDPPQNWTLGGVETLTLFFRGQQDNTGQLYAKINGVKVPYDGGAEGLSRVTWQTWNIDLASLGTDLTNVQTLVIGIEGASASGTLFVDDIHLYKVTPMAPREPDSAHMVAHYAFEGDVTDSSGNGHDGEILGDAGFVAGMAGQALSFDGADDFVRISDDDRLNPGAGNFSFTLWAKLDLTASMSGSAEWDLAIVKRQTGSNGYYIGANRDVGRTSEASFKFMVGSTSAVRVDTPYLAVPLGEWVFISAVLDRDQNIHKISTNGGSTWATATPPSGPIVPAQDLSMGFDSGADNYWFHGTIDEVRLYDTALTDAEVMWLANDL